MTDDIAIPAARLMSAQVLPVGGATADRLSSLPIGVSSFVDTWVSAPHRPEPIARDFTFKAVIGEPDW